MNGGEKGDPGCMGYGYKCMQWDNGGNKYGCEWDKTNCGAGHMNDRENDKSGCMGYGYKCMQWYDGSNGGEDTCTGNMPACPTYSMDPYQNIQNLLWNPTLGAPGDVVAGFAYGGGRKVRNPNAMLGDLLSM
jgi:hypothetical protein